MTLLEQLTAGIRVSPAYVPYAGQTAKENAKHGWLP